MGVASGAISNLQSALNCVGKCDCCDKLQSQIDALKAQLAGIDSKYIPRANEASIINTAKIQAKDLIMPLAISYVLSQLKPIQALITGLENSLFRLSGQITNFVAKLTALEVGIGNALKTAASALGISNQALKAVGELFAKIAPLLNILGTIANILQTIATLETLGARIDAVEAQVMGLGREISNILGSILPALKARIGANEVLANQANSIARDARLIGEAANLKAGAAQVTASRAEGYATTAQAKALQAQLTADGAVRNATRANENATTAYQKAIQAEREAIKSGDAAREASKIGNQAKRIAGDAFSKAGQAIGTALTAITIATTAITIARAVKGIPGPRGFRRFPGLRGFRGFPGIPGTNGVMTVVTLPGTPGTPGRNGINGINGINGRNGIDVNPADIAGLRALIVSQHTQTRANSTVQHSATRTTILTPIMAALAPILAICKQIFDAVNKFSNAAILALLEIINKKLGGQIIGGISQHLTNFTSWAVLDRVLNLMTFAATIHNAAMLSNNLGQTLLSAVSNVLSIFGIKNSEGNPLDISSIIGSTLETLIKSVIGETNYKILNTTWKNASRIYQATANILNAVQSIGASILNALEVVGQWNAKVANALKRFGVVGEKAYSWMNPNVNFQNKYFTALENATNVISQVDQVASEVLSIKETVGQIVEQKKEIDDSLKEFDNSKQKTELPEAAKLAQKESESKTASAALPVNENDKEPDED